MKEITKLQADAIIHENLHRNVKIKVVLCVRGKWFDIRGMKKHEIASAITKVFGFSVNPDAII